MKQVVIFTPNDLEAMREGINYALWHIRNNKPLCDDDYGVIERQLQNLQNILYKEDD